jgi:hypothetical protein
METVVVAVERVGIGAVVPLDGDNGDVYSDIWYSKIQKMDR